ncbi:hypothetical protein BJY04DRAFT_219665 [Aspergillus karnatakaensis]|uniref:F-box protein n=1 Tax=Aspergillus karnatakaensis TaxID=1810916 RepID=UPI003CCCC9BB
MWTLATVPAEILLQIFEFCDDIRQLEALSATCKQLHFALTYTAWWTNLKFAKRNIIAFDDALVAVHATALVLKAWDDGRLPPQPLPLHTLTWQASRPYHDELDRVRDLEHLVKCIQVTMCNEQHGNCDSALSKRQCHRCQQQNLNIRLAFYKLFTIGAFLCGCYQQPFVGKDPSRPPGFLSRFQRGSTDLERGHMPVQRVLYAEDIQYLLNFPLFRFNAFDEHDSIYADLVQFILGGSEARAQDEPATTCACFQAVEHSHGHCYHGESGPIQSKFECLSDFEYQVPLRQAAQLIGDLAQLITAMEWLGHDNFFSIYGSELEICSNGQVRKVVTIPVGSFRPIEWTMPASLTEAWDKGVCSRPLQLKSSDGSQILSPASPLHLQPLDSFLCIFWAESGQPNFYGPGCPKPHPPLHFFEYMFRKYLGMRFADTAFNNEYHDVYEMWTQSRDTFDDQWAKFGDMPDTFARAEAPPAQNVYRHALPYPYNRRDR